MATDTDKTLDIISGAAMKAAEEANVRALRTQEALARVEAYIEEEAAKIAAAAPDKVLAEGLLHFSNEYPYETLATAAMVIADVIASQRYDVQQIMFSGFVSHVGGSLRRINAEEIREGRG